jgi:hypothetical protein
MVESLHLTPTHNFVRELLSSMLHNEGLQVHPICASFIWELLNLCFNFFIHYSFINIFEHALTNNITKIE